MKKSSRLVVVAVVGFLVLSQFGMMRIYGERTNQINPETPTAERSFSHTVLGEMETAYWCHFCKFAHAALENIYDAHWYPFYYISLETARNKHAMARAVELGYDGSLPKVFFDSGYRMIEGASSIPVCQQKYNVSIRDCGNRTNVADIDLHLNVTWLGAATIKVGITAVNNNATEYQGCLRVYVTEIASTMGWNDSAGHPYTFVFLDYAVDRFVTIPAQGSWSNTTIWDGHQYNDGYGHNFGNITENNIMVIAAIFNNNTKYADETIGAKPGTINNPPYEPSNPSPANNSVGVGVHVNLSWTGGDPDLGDTVNYTIWYWEVGSDHATGKKGITNEWFDLGILKDNTTYGWFVRAFDNHGASNTSPLWYFTTEKLNHPPYQPSNPNPENHTINEPITAHLSWNASVDPDGDPVTYDVFFGTTSPPPEKGNQSGTTYSPAGGLNYNTKYYWKIVAWDNHSASNASPVWDFTTETAPQPPKPDLDCQGTLNWTSPKIKPGATVTGSFTVKNIGQAASKLNWEVKSWPLWGTWTFYPSSGTNLTPGSSVVGQVTVVAPNEKNKAFTGEVKLVNKNNSSDFVILQVSLATPKDKSFVLHFLDQLLERFPVLARLLALSPFFSKLLHLQ
jgi:hypothetical protein